MSLNDMNSPRRHPVRRTTPPRSGQDPSAPRTPAAPQASPAAPQSRGASGREPARRSSSPAQTARRPSANLRPTADKAAQVRRPENLPIPANEARRKPQAPKQQRQPKPTKSRADSTALSSLVKAIVYIIVILIVSATFSYYGITIGNDVFAFRKTGEAIEITVDADLTVEALAEQLHEKGVIRYKQIFVFYAELRKKDEGFIATTETVSPSMSYDELLAAFKEKPKQPETIRVTIPEGFTVDEIIDLFVNEYGVGSREGFVSAIQDYPFDYWFVKELDSAELRRGRKYRLEGYLYPDTYYFYTTSSEVTIINKFLANFEDKFDDKFVERARMLGWTVDDVIILASMIQMEAKFESDYGSVSSVFHNRLASNKTQGKLESDATIQYVLEDRTEDLTNEMLNLDSPYNTRLYAGLPPGSITNVTLYAINYALFPNETDYYYFVSRPGGYTLFAETYAGHQKNIERVEYEKQNGTLPDW